MQHKSFSNYELGMFLRELISTKLGNRTKYNSYGYTKHNKAWNKLIITGTRSGYLSLILKASAFLFSAYCINHQLFTDIILKLQSNYRGKKKKRFHTEIMVLLEAAFTHLLFLNITNFQNHRFTQKKRYLPNP